jgi:hypothetical protein
MDTQDGIREIQARANEMVSPRVLVDEIASHRKLLRIPFFVATVFSASQVSGIHGKNISNRLPLQK